MTLGDSNNGGIIRESPISFIGGGVFHLFDNVDAKPAAMFQISNAYAIPSKQLPQSEVPQYTTVDLLANFIIDEHYVVGVLVGRSKAMNVGGINNFGLCASFVLNGLRLGYSIQQNSRAASGVSLPIRHMITAGYDFWQEEDASPRYF